MGNIRDLYEARENLPTHEEIEKRAYELYLKDGDEFSPTEYWFRAKAELTQERSGHREPVKTNAKAVSERRI